MENLSGQSHRVLSEDYRRGAKTCPDGLGITDEALSWAKHASVYHSKPDAEPEFKAIAQACEDNLIEILRNCPPCADRTHALNHVRMARMWGNSAVALEE